MAVKLEINANVTGANQIKNLNDQLKNVGTSTSLADRALKTFNNAAERGRRTIESFGNAVKIAVAAGFGLAIYESQKFVKEIIKVGTETENLKSRLELAFENAADGARAFQYINQYASKTPYSLSQISRAFNDLKEISRTPADIANNLELAGRIAARFNIPFEEAVEGLQKSIQGGIESSRTFKNLGIAEIIGYQEGVTYSVDEVTALFQGTFGNGGRLAKSVDAFRGTLSGQVSELENSFNKVKQAAGGVVVSGLTAQLQRLKNEFGGTNESLEEFGVKIGTKIVDAFIKLEDILRFVVNNFDKFLALITAFVAIDIANKVLGVLAAFTSFGTTIANVTGLVKLFNLAWAFSPIGTLAVVITGIVTAFVIWRKEIYEFIKVLDIGLEKLKLFINGVSQKLLGKTVFNTVKEEAETAANSIENLENTLDKSLGGTQEFEIKDPSKQINDILANVEVDPIEVKLEVTKVPTDTIIRDAEDAANQSIEAFIKEYENSEEFKIKIQTILEQPEGPPVDVEPFFEGFGTIADDAYRLRQIFDDLNLDSQQIGDAISDSWINGLKEGGSLMERIVNLSKSLLNNIIEQIARQTIQIGVEKVFDALSNKRRANSDAITKSINEQTTATTVLANVSKYASSIWDSIKNGVSGALSLVGSLIQSVGRVISRLFEQLVVEKLITNEKQTQAAVDGGGGGSFLGSIGKVFGFADGGVVPGGAPYTDRVPALLTPGETIIPRGESGIGSQAYTTYITQNLNTNDLQSALLSAIRTNAETVNQILQAERNK